MAKNWTIAEAIVAYSNNDKNAIADIGKRFPLIADMISRVVSGDKDATMKLFGLLPEYNTLNRLNTAAKEGLTEDDVEDVEETEVEEKKPAKKAKKSEPEEEEETEDEGEEDSDAVDYEKMTAQQIYNLGRKRGIKFKSTKKADMIEVMKAADAGDGEEVEEEEDAENGYEDMTPQELFKECKKRSIKTEPKQKASVYVKLLKADDAKAEETEEDDDWGDEEEVEEKKPAKKADKKVEKKTEKKAPKKDEDEDDDWDI